MPKPITTNSRDSLHVLILANNMAYFRITLLRSAIGLPEKYSGVLKALGLTRRMKTVFLPVTRDTAGQILAVKELVDVQEVDQRISNKAMKNLRRPDPGYYIETKVHDLKPEWS